MIKHHSITRNWGSRQFCLEYSKKIDDWLNQFEDYQKKLLKKLLKNYSFYQNEKIHKRIVTLYENFKESFPEEYNDIYYFSLITDTETHFSDVFFNNFWSILQIKQNCYRNFLDYINEINFKKIAFVDDFCGTGNTFIEFINLIISQKEILKNSTIYFLVLHITEIGIKNINKFAHINNLNINIIYDKKTYEAFKDDYIFKKNDIDKKHKIYNQISEDKQILDKYRYGYGDCQSLVSFKYNTPNNTLGIFWAKNDIYKPLFSRDRKNQYNLDVLKKNRLKQKELKNNLITNNKKTKPLFSENIPNKYKNAIIYFLQNNKSLFDKTCNDLGMTKKQLSEVITYLNKRKLIICIKGNIYPTQKLKENINLLKIKNIIKNNYNKSKDNISYDFDDDININYKPKDFKNKFEGY